MRCKKLKIFSNSPYRFKLVGHANIRNYFNRDLRCVLTDMPPLRPYGFAPVAWCLSTKGKNICYVQPKVIVMPKSRRALINVENVLDTLLVLSVDRRPTQLDDKFAADRLKWSNKTETRRPSSVVIYLKLRYLIMEIRTYEVMTIVFWRGHGVLLADFMSKGTTINAGEYCEILRKLRRTIRNKRRCGRLTKGVRLHQDNARPHVARKITIIIEEIPPNSPDIAPGDFRLFYVLKKRLGRAKVRERPRSPAGCYRFNKRGVGKPVRGGNTKVRLPDAESH